jgi:hypothetical protein
MFLRNSISGKPYRYPTVYLDEAPSSKEYAYRRVKP